MSDRFGRKLTAALGNGIILVSGALLTGSVNPAMFIVFRFFNGLGYEVEHQNPHLQKLMN